MCTSCVRIWTNASLNSYLARTPSHIPLIRYFSLRKTTSWMKKMVLRHTCISYVYAAAISMHTTHLPFLLLVSKTEGQTIWNSYTPGVPVNFIKFHLLSWTPGVEKSWQARMSHAHCVNISYNSTQSINHISLCQYSKTLYASMLLIPTRDRLSCNAKNSLQSIIMAGELHNSMYSVRPATKYASFEDHFYERRYDSLTWQYWTYLDIE